VDTCPGAAIRLDAKLTSKGPQRQSDSLAALDGRPWQIERILLLGSPADSATATRRRGRIVAIATEERIDPVVFAGR
jgi:hypothetical protein